ncbi:EAL domain-containing protein [Leeia oryzae]|uniref:EAL domain-containing protein n=1 Tax=Leeia oryzae TaxID=356662 RepID=UPI0003705001|nr:EAL domain-containing protein [Leeia oryzae]
MINISRTRFILISVTSYLILALAWIFLSDQMLEMLADKNTVVHLSTAKGIFFVLASTAIFFFVLRAVPSAAVTQHDSLLGIITTGLANEKRSAWLVYGFALVITLSMLVLRGKLQVDMNDHPMMVLFMLPIILSALIGGLGPGLLSTLITAVWIDFSITPHLHTLASSPFVIMQWAFLIVNGIAVSTLSGLLRQSLAKLTVNRHLLESIVTGSSDAIFVKNLQGQYLLINAAAAGFVNKTPEDVLGKDDLALFDEASARDIMQKDRQIMESGQVLTSEEYVTVQAGEDYVFQSTKGTVRDVNGKVNGLFGISRDITRQRHAEEKLQEREQQLARVIDGSGQGYWEWSLLTDQFQVSAHLETMLGYTPGEMNVSTEAWPQYVHPQDFSLVNDSVQKHLRGETPQHKVEARYRTKSGEWRWMLSRGRVVAWTPDGKPSIMSGTYTDITRQKLQELALQEAAVVFESSYDGIMVVNADKIITRVNSAFTRITGYSAEEAVGSPPSLLSSDQQSPAFYRDMWHTIKDKDFWRGEIWNKRKSGELYAELLSISVVRDAIGDIQYYIGIFSDISQLKTHEAELERVAHYDELTGVPNRRLLSDRFHQSILRSARQGRLCAVCCLDLDDFKVINDNYGVQVGNQLLIEITNKLNGVIRVNDTVARLGGDEFVLLLSELSSHEECIMVLERVLACVREDIRLGDLTLKTTVSMGVSLYPEDNVDPDTLLRHADKAMFMAKEAGKNRYQLFDPESDLKAQSHREFLQMLRTALCNEEFVLYYQPKVDLVARDIIGVEALIRWQHPEKGVLSPAEFLPQIYGSDLEAVFGEWVIKTVMQQASAWLADGLRIRISLNVSANHLLMPGFYEFLAATLASYPDVPPALLELEILESAAIADMEQAIDILGHCRELGVHFALDDFGTGYSSLTYLRRLPVDILKIDQSFVRDMLKDPDDMRIVEGVIQLANVFNRVVIAEGVETLAHGDMLCKLGCNLAQGYGIARPMPASVLPAWCDTWKAQDT